MFFGGHLWNLVSSFARLERQTRSQCYFSIQSGGEGGEVIGTLGKICFREKDGRIGHPIFPSCFIPRHLSKASCLSFQKKSFHSHANKTNFLHTVILWLQIADCRLGIKCRLRPKLGINCRLAKRNVYNAPQCHAITFPSLSAAKSFLLGAKRQHWIGRLNYFLNQKNITYLFARQTEKTSFLTCRD